MERLKEVFMGTTYKNKKTNNLYLVLSQGKHTETLEEMVIYRRISGEDNTVWVRPIDIFKEKFEEFR